MTPEQTAQEAAPETTSADDNNLKNFSTTDVAHQGANDDDPTGAKAAGGLENSDIAPNTSDEGSRRAGKGAYGAGQ